MPQPGSARMQRTENSPRTAPGAALPLSSHGARFPGTARAVRGAAPQPPDGPRAPDAAPRSPARPRSPEPVDEGGAVGSPQPAAVARGRGAPRRQLQVQLHFLLSHRGGGSGSSRSAATPIHCRRPPRLLTPRPPLQAPRASGTRRGGRPQ